jgi:hypothetical protein
LFVNFLWLFFTLSFFFFLMYFANPKGTYWIIYILTIVFRAIIHFN